MIASPPEPVTEPIISTRVRHRRRDGAAGDCRGRQADDGAHGRSRGARSCRGGPMPRLAARPGDLVLVTGATGRIGANLCRALRARDYRIRAVVLPGDRAVAKLVGLHADVVEADLRDEAAVVAACEGVDAICHLAA